MTLRVASQLAAWVERPQPVWFVVAHRSGARVYAGNATLRRFRQVGELDFPDGRRKARDLQSDRPGRPRGRLRSSERSAYSPHENVHEHLAGVFARRLAKYIAEARAADRFSFLVLAAEPRFMGRLRSALDTVSRARIVATVEKSLHNGTESRLRAALAEAAQAAGRARLSRPRRR